VANLFIRSELLSGPRLRGVLPAFSAEEKWQKARNLNACFHTLPGENLILSAEGFSNFRTKQEGQFMKPLMAGFDVKVVLIEREKESWSRSYNAQIARLRTNFFDLIGDKGTMFDFSPNSWHHDLSGLKAIFPTADIFQYETLLQTDKSVIPTFLTWLGIEAAKFDELNIWENRTYPPNVTTMIS